MKTFWFTRGLLSLVLLLVWCTLGQAQGLTPTQLQTLKTDIMNRSAQFATELAAKDHPAIANWYNQATNPVVNLWRPDVLVKEMNPGIVWADFDLLADGKKSTYLAMTQAQVIDTTSQNVRDGFSVIFGNGSTTASNLLGIVKRVGTNFEVLFSGAQVQGARVTTVYGRACTYIDVQQALALP